MNGLFAIWVWTVAYLNCAGWLLSVLGWLNAGGYALALAPGILLAWLWLRRNLAAISLQKIFRRARCSLPAIFIFITALIFLGGILYAPSNFDALTYRLPRTLNWLHHGHWFWISTINERQNFSGVVWEWTAAPQLALLGSDRALFLINFIGFCLLPGLIFSVFRQLGAARRSAWTWMWLLPLAYGYVTQAGSIGNDLTGTVFVLASLHFGLRARRSGRIQEVALALLAAALLTGTKLSNLPLALPCLVAVWPALKRLKNDLAVSAIFLVAAAVISALPIMVLNQIYTGHWGGDPHNEYKLQIQNPVVGVLGNGLLILEQALTPPVLPGSNQIHAWFARVMPEWIKADFPRLLIGRINELPAEEGSGLGLSTTLPLALAAGVLIRRREGGEWRRLFSPVVVTGWIAFLFFLAKMGSEAGPRLLLPYYPLVLVPLCGLRFHGEWLRGRVGRVFFVCVALAALPLLVFSMARPLWPAQAVVKPLAAAHPRNQTLQRLATTYVAYANRNDILASLRAALPDNVEKIGFIASSNDSSYSLWRPFGRRHVTDLRPRIHSLLENPEGSGSEWVVVKVDIWPEFSAQSFDEWVAAHKIRIVKSESIIQLVSAGPQRWCVLQILNAAP